MFFVRTQRTPTQTDTTILSVYSLSLVTIITGHRVSDKVTVLGKRQLCVVKCKRKDLLSTSIVGKKLNVIPIFSFLIHFSIVVMKSEKSCIQLLCVGGGRVAETLHLFNLGSSS
jgi:hypothetical protein